MITFVICITCLIKFIYLYFANNCTVDTLWYKNQIWDIQVHVPGIISKILETVGLQAVSLLFLKFKIKNF
jgi:hypothetical protein